MTYIIAEPCLDTTDTACVAACPVDCIYLNNESYDKSLGKAKPVSNPVMDANGNPMNILYIHPQECIDCGACEPECPPVAIFKDDAVPAKWDDYTTYNYQAFGLERP